MEPPNTRRYAPRTDTTPKPRGVLLEDVLGPWPNVQNNAIDLFATLQERHIAQTGHRMETEYLNGATIVGRCIDDSPDKRECIVTPTTGRAWVEDDHGRVLRYADEARKG